MKLPRAYWWAIIMCLVFVAVMLPLRYSSWWRRFLGQPFAPTEPRAN